MTKNIEIYLYGQKKLFFQKELKKRSVSLNLNIFGDMAKKRFFQSAIKKTSLPRNMDIYGDLAYSVVHSKTLTCCGGA